MDKQTKAETALAMVRSLTAQGIEYPDAEYKVSAKLKLNEKQLQALRHAYDAPEGE